MPRYLYSAGHIPLQTTRLEREREGSEKKITVPLNTDRQGYSLSPVFFDEVASALVKPGRAMSLSRRAQTKVNENVTKNLEGWDEGAAFVEVPGMLWILRNGSRIFRQSDNRERERGFLGVVHSEFVPQGKIVSKEFYCELVTQQGSTRPKGNLQQLQSSLPL